MPHAKRITLAAALLIGCATFAQAQSDSGNQGRSGMSARSEESASGQSGRQDQSSAARQNSRRGYDQMTRNRHGHSFQERAMLRRQLRRLGFRNIQILNATFLVRAKSKDGRSFLMIADPDLISNTSASFSGSRDREDNRQGRDAMGQGNRGSGDNQSQGRRENRSRSGQGDNR